VTVVVYLVAGTLVDYRTSLADKSVADTVTVHDDHVLVVVLVATILIVALLVD
jgi:hypothetical protein